MAKKIMIIRHGEKPEDDTHGVSAAGEHDKHELSPQGWQRAGALVRFFNPMPGVAFSHPGLARPDAIFAEGGEDHVKALRPQHTVQAVAESLKLKMNLQHTKGQENELVKSVVATNGVVLIAWEHGAIIDIANILLGNDKSSPQKWHGSRFDLVWVFDPGPAAGTWKFSQIPQMLLPGDSPQLL
jgi:broad specificity phosphatase PhoE